MTNKTEHTPTPWKWCGNEIEAGKYGELEVMAPGVSCGMHCYGGMVELGISNADKSHIVRCVNYHNRLVEALRSCTSVMCDGSGLISYSQQAIAKAEALELLTELEQQK